MLTMDAKRNAESYSYPNGMLNTGWIAGVLRLPDPANGICYIQQTRSENHMLPIHFDPKTSPLPRDLKEWDLVMAYCHVQGSRDGDQRVVALKSIRFEAANALHMDKKFAQALLQIAREGQNKSRGVVELDDPEANTWLLMTMVWGAIVQNVLQRPRHLSADRITSTLVEMLLKLIR